MTQIKLDIQHLFANHYHICETRELTAGSSLNQELSEVLRNSWKCWFSLMGEVVWLPSLQVLMTCSGISRSKESHRAPDILTRRIIVYKRAARALQKVGTRYDLTFIGIGKDVVHLTLGGFSII